MYEFAHKPTEYNPYPLLRLTENNHKESNVDKSIETVNYKVNHKISVPSRVGDYDYDPNNPDRRFVSTYIHTLEFRDKITDQEVITLTMSSEECANLISALYIIDYTSTNNDSCAYTICYVYKDNIPCKLVACTVLHCMYFRIFTEDGKTLIALLNFAPLDVSKLIAVLENEAVDELYVSFTSDRGGHLPYGI